MTRAGVFPPSERLYRRITQLDVRTTVHSFPVFSARDARLQESSLYFPVGACSVTGRSVRSKLIVIAVLQRGLTHIRPGYYSARLPLSPGFLPGPGYDSARATTR
ncbi:unnamed protein product [Arctogadus glacialis]